MTKARLSATYLFLFLVPYALSLMLISCAYDALINHYQSWWRLILGGLVGMGIMYALKIIIARPLRLLAKFQIAPLWQSFSHFFLLSGRPKLIILNGALDFSLIVLLSLAIRYLVPLKWIVGPGIGILLAACFVSALIGAYMAFDDLTIDPQH